MKKMYSVLIADIKSSKTYDANSRFEIQDRLQKIVIILNELFHNYMVLKLDFSSGDSVQGLFNSVSKSLQCFYLLRVLFSPYEIRCGIGVGDINDKIFNDGKILYADGSTNFNDGSAYHLANQALTHAKQKDYGVLVFSESFCNDIYINHLLITSHEMRNKLTNSQAELMNLYEYLNPLLDDNLWEGYEHLLFRISDFVTIKNKLSERSMIQEWFKHDLEKIFIINKNSLAKESKHHFEMRVFESDINSRNSDLYFSKLFGVSPQNISLLRIRGHMNKIRTTEMLGKFFLQNNYD